MKQPGIPYNNTINLKSIVHTVRLVKEKVLDGEVSIRAVPETIPWGCSIPRTPPPEQFLSQNPRLHP
jgi:hypothetical protein